MRASRVRFTDKLASPVQLHRLPGAKGRLQWPGISPEEASHEIIPCRRSSASIFYVYRELLAAFFRRKKRGLRVNCVLRALDGSLAGSVTSVAEVLMGGTGRVHADWTDPLDHLRDIRHAISRGRALMGLS